jgi:hypothetical protein
MFTWSSRISISSLGIALSTVILGIAGFQQIADVRGSPSSVSPAGNYIAVVRQADVKGTDHVPLHLTVSGGFAFKNGPKGTWTINAKHVITMSGSLNGVAYAFTAKQLANNLGTTSREGKVTEGGHPFGRWYAARVS